MDAALKVALDRHGLFVEAVILEDLQRSVHLTAPDLILLLGDAAEDGGLVALTVLASDAGGSAAPVVILAADARLESRMHAFRHGATAVVQRSASADAIARQVTGLTSELSEHFEEKTGEIGEATFDELVELVKKELRSGILSVHAPNQKGGPTRVVLGAGRPVAAAVQEFVARLKPHVTTADAMYYQFHTSAGGPVELLELESAGGSLEALSRLRVLLVDDDPARADTLAQELRLQRSIVFVTDTHGRGLDRAAGLDPQVAIIDAAGLEGPGFEVVRSIRKDVRLRWASILVAPWDDIWPRGASMPNLERLTARIEPLLQPERELAERAQAAPPFDARLESTGPCRLLRVLVESGFTLHLTIRNPKAVVEVDLAEGLLVGAKCRTAAGEAVEGAAALATLLALGSGRVHIERRANPSVANVMSPVDDALSMASAERSLVPASIPPAAGDAAREEPAVAASGARGPTGAKGALPLAKRDDHAAALRSAVAAAVRSATPGPSPANRPARPPAATPAATRSAELRWSTPVEAHKAAPEPDSSDDETCVGDIAALAKAVEEAVASSEAAASSETVRPPLPVDPRQSAPTPLRPPVPAAVLGGPVAANERSRLTARRRSSTLLMTSPLASPPDPPAAEPPPPPSRPLPPPMTAAVRAPRSAGLAPPIDAGASVELEYGSASMESLELAPDASDTAASEEVRERSASRGDQAPTWRPEAPRDALAADAHGVRDDAQDLATAVLAPITLPPPPAPLPPSVARLVDPLPLPPPAPLPRTIHAPPRRGALRMAAFASVITASVVLGAVLGLIGYRYSGLRQPQLDSLLVFLGAAPRVPDVPEPTPSSPPEPIADPPIADPPIADPPIADPVVPEPIAADPVPPEPIAADPVLPEPVADPIPPDPIPPEPAGPEPTGDSQGAPESAGTDVANLLASAERAGTPELAERLYRRVLELEPREHHAMVGLGRILLDRGAHAEAAQQLRGAVRRRPRRGAYRVLLGDALVAGGDAAGARREWELALEHEPNNAQARQRLGQ